MNPDIPDYLHIANEAAKNAPPDPNRREVLDTYLSLVLLASMYQQALAANDGLNAGPVKRLNLSLLRSSDTLYVASERRRVTIERRAFDGEVVVYAMYAGDEFPEVHLKASSVGEAVQLAAATMARVVSYVSGG